MKVTLKPINMGEKIETDNQFSKMVLENQDEYYEKIGFNPPWISYFAFWGTQIVGVCSFKGSPTNGRVEIAYFTFPDEEGKGYGRLMCEALVEIARKFDPDIVITARTLPESNASTSILKKNGFEIQGVVMDDDDGEVWEWINR